MREIVETFLTVFVATFPILDPIGGALIFLSMTAHASTRIRRMMAVRVALYSFLFLNASLFIGAYVLNFFGISLPVLRVAGGLLVAATGWKMLNQETLGEPSARALPANLRDAEYMQRAFYPITMPLITGPGTIAVLIALGTGRPVELGDSRGWFFVVGAVAATVAMSITTYASFVGAGVIRRVLGSSGTEVVTRLMAFILVCIGVQILWTGAQELIVTLPGR